MDEKDGRPSVMDILAQATEEDLKLAAEALVDAALCCHNAADGNRISEKTRRFLVEEVHRNPALTPYLFDRELSSAGWC